MTNEKLWKETLNSDVQQFHKYQQNEQSPLTLTELTEHKRPRHMTMKIKVLDLDKHKNVLGGGGSTG